MLPMPKKIHLSKGNTVTTFLTRTLALGALTTVFLTACSAEPETTIQPQTRASYSDGTQGIVQEVKSGNTVSVKLGEQVKDVRMLNVVAPTKSNVEISGDCLINESTRFLAEKLPRGTEVTLNFDPTQTGSSGFVDAAVYVGEDFINKDVLAAGLATTTYATEKDKFYPQLSAAQQQAAKDGLGLYSPDTECSIAHQLQEHLEAVKAAANNPKEEERTAQYKRSSDFYNRLIQDSKSAITWTGSIVTLDATKAKLEELKSALGKNYYNEKGQTEAEALASASTNARPEGSENSTSVPTPTEEETSTEEATG